MQTAVFIILSVIAIIVALAFFYHKLKQLTKNDAYIAELQSQLNLMDSKLAVSSRDIEYLNQTNKKLGDEAQILKREVINTKDKQQELYNEKLTLANELSGFKSENENLKKAYVNLEDLLDKLKTDLNQEFNNMKQQALLELQNKANDSLMTIGKNSVVDPLNQRLRELDEKIIELKKETRDISAKSAGLSDQANNLAQALIRDSHKKGEFGEMILSNILEYAGLKDKVNYFEQTSITTLSPEAKNLRPDCVVHLPDERGIIIDSKNIVGEYYNGLNSGIDKIRAISQAVNSTVKNLSGKDYIAEVTRITGRSVFDYMIMFIPNEGLFNLIVEEESKHDSRGVIWSAYAQKIITAGPSTILPLLAMIERMWQNHEIEEKTVQILKLASELSDQLRLTLERMTVLGNSINKVASNYDDIVKSLANGAASSAVGKLAQLANYKREIINNQPILGEELIKRFPVNNI